MHIPIPIPIGAKHVAAVRGAVWKFVSCTHCQQRYAYLLELEATGVDHDLAFLDGKGSAERARALAERNLLQKSRNVVLPVNRRVKGPIDHSPRFMTLLGYKTARHRTGAGREIRK